jgi:hypothetical protein
MLEWMTWDEIGAWLKANGFKDASDHISDIAKEGDVRIVTSSIARYETLKSKRMI